MVGLPLTLAGRGGPAGRRADVCGAARAESLCSGGAHDERLTTRLAERAGGRGDADSRAAAHLLESYLARTSGRPSELGTAARPGRTHTRGAGGRRSARARRAARGRDGGRAVRRRRLRRPTPARPTGSARPSASRARRRPRRPPTRARAVRPALGGHRGPGVILLASCWAWRPGWPTRSSSPSRADGGAPVRVSIPRGASLGEIADLLEQPGVARGAGFFQLRARLAGRSGDLSRARTSCART